MKHSQPLSFVACFASAAMLLAPSCDRPTAPASVADLRAPDLQPFTLVLIPDTQYYAQESNPTTYAAQMRWIADNAKSRRIVHAIHLGDMTHGNTDAEWNVADAAHRILDTSGIPYSVCPGNHDNPNSGRTRDTTRFNRYFGQQRFRGKTFYGGGFAGKNDSNYTFFQAAGQKYLVLSLEFAPRKDVLCWADDVIRRHPQHRVIVVTHCYLTNGARYANCTENYGLIGSGGETVWDELVRRHSNVFMVLSGHITDSEYRLRRGLAGNPVHEILTDYQNERRAGKKHGNGWMRTVEFIPRANRVDVKIHTVLSDVTRLNQTSVYSADPHHSDHAYSFPFAMTGPVNYRFTDRRERYNDRTANSTTSGEQRHAAVATDGKGNSYVVWADDSDKNGKYQIKARGLSDFGCERIPAFTVNRVSTGDQIHPDVACDKDGNWVVVWQDDRAKSGVYEVYARGFDARGVTTIPEFVVNGNRTGQHLYPKVAKSELGRFVVVWQDDSDGNGSYQIHGRGFFANGRESIRNFTVNSVAKGQQLRPDVGMDRQGGFAVVWQDDTDNNGTYQIYARGFVATGQQRFADMTVNATAAGQQLDPAIGMNAAGRFVVVWEDDQDKDNVFDIYLAGFSPIGAKIVTDRAANKIASGQQRDAVVGVDASGRFTVAWSDDNNSNGIWQIHARGFSANGAERFSQRAVNKVASGQQLEACLATVADGRFVVGWSDDANKNGFYDIVCRGLTVDGR